MIVLVLWLAIVFAGFGLVTAKNPTVIVTLLLCALSLAGAVFMIEELNRPLEGLMKISSAPLRIGSQRGMSAAHTGPDGHAVGRSLKSSSAAMAWRKRNFCTFPVTVVGKVSTNLTKRGIL